MIKVNIRQQNNEKQKKNNIDKVLRNIYLPKYKIHIGLINTKSRSNLFTPPE